MISKEKKQAIIAEYGRCEGDTGSPEVRIEEKRWYKMGGRNRCAYRRL